MNKVLIKIDKNGSKHWEGDVKCDRCSGTGTYVWGACVNGVYQYAGVCFKCGGSGKVHGHWIERTPEYQAKLDAKRQAKIEARQAEYAEKQRAIEEARKAREDAIRAEKAKSEYVGEIGQKIEVMATYVGSGQWEQKSYVGFGTQTMFAHNFKDDNGNKLVWKTTSYMSGDGGERVLLKGTIKDHSEYDGEKQTLLTRCKIKEV